MSTTIDAHTHVIAVDEESYPVDPIGGKRSTWSTEHPVDIDGLLRALDTAGVERSVAVQASTVYGHDNSYVAEAVRRHPDRFIGVYSIDAMASDAVQKIQHWQGFGLSGFRLFTTGTTMPGQADWLGDPASYPAWSYAQEHGIPICLQMTLDGIPALQRTLAEFPRSRVVLDHCARPVLSDGAPYRRAQGLFDLAEHPGVYLKLTHRALQAAAEGRSTVEEFLAALVETYGSERLMWGSNYPAASGELVDLVAAARGELSSLSEEDLANVFGRTVAAFYALDEKDA
ncbi:amidohydrolase family protein [Microlunatus soli]|uniref:Predicted metal-dependent hydrolase, TIM-barrel fold n=1 Tax=Microlunatus soli TaxID=630515 RepID=A0A1H1YM49_9ACTN|nr:amidohydrolase family protein [Microlunatus soli]SDT22481.1 Predicted metal-dependent hydrolase, TIM-barrel fold [Microlunatus soli]